MCKAKSIGRFAVWALAALLFMVASPVCYAQTDNGDPQPARQQTLDGLAGPGLKVYVLPMHGAIDQGLMILFRRAFREIEQIQPDLLIIDIDTPGGRLRETEEIIAWMRSSRVPIFAFVNTHALSAGAIVSFASNQIYMAPGSRIGSALPIMVGPGGVADLPPDVQEKLLSDTRALVRGVAQEQGHWEDIAVAMVDPSYEVRINDRVISEAGELLNLTAREAIEIIPPRVRPILAEAMVEDINDLLDYIGFIEPEVVYLEPLPAEKLARWIIMIGPLLFALGVIGIYMEFQSPGIGLPGIVGGTCLLIYFFGHYVGGLAGIEAMVLIAIGLILIIIEVFVLPGFGVAGILGLFSMVAGLVLSVVPRLPDLPRELPELPTPGMVDYLTVISWRLILTFTFSAIGIWLLSRFLPKIPFYGKLVLQKTLAAGGGWDETQDQGYRQHLGRVGMAMTNLRPAGTAVFDNDRLDVVTTGDMIAKGSKIKVVQVAGSRIVVEKTENKEHFSTTDGH